MNEISSGSEMNVSNQMSQSEDNLSSSHASLNLVEKQIPKKYNIQNVQLSKKSRKLLIFRVILIFSIFIFLPMEILLETRLESIEKDHFIQNIKSKYDIETLSRWVKGFKVFNYFFSNKDIIMVYICLIYTFIHPFIGLKLVLVINFLDYVITLLKCILQAKRPFWYDKEKLFPLCEVNFAKPSGQFFLCSFFLMYIPICFNLIKKKKERVSKQTRLIYFLIYFALIIFHSFILIVYRLQFVYQIIYSLTISLVCISFLSDFDIFIHNMILRSMKTIFKSRQYKMRFLFRVLLLILFSLFVNYSINLHNINSLENNIALIKACKDEDIKEFGLPRTFLGVPYLFGVIGAFWGASLTIETDCHKWWEGNNTFKIVVKLLLTLFTSAGILVAFYYMIAHVSYEFDFTLQCIKYIMFYYVIMGLLPLLYEKLKLNEVKVMGNKKKLMDVPLEIFTSSILIGRDEFENVSFSKEEDKKQKGKYEIIKEEDNENDEDELDDKMKGTLGTQEKIFRSSQFIKGIKQKDKNEGGIDYKMNDPDDEEI